MLTGLGGRLDEFRRDIQPGEAGNSPHGGGFRMKIFAIALVAMATLAIFLLVWSEVAHKQSTGVVVEKVYVKPYLRWGGVLSPKTPYSESWYIGMDNGYRHCLYFNDWQNISIGDTVTVEEIGWGTIAKVILIERCEDAN